MTSKQILRLQIVVAMLLSLVVGAQSGALAQTPKPAVTKEAARKTVLAKVPGAHIFSAELEKEEGKLVWSFDLRDHWKLEEAWVDAATGEVIKLEVETKASEAKEKRMDIAEAMVKHKTHGKITGTSTEGSGKDEVYVFEVQNKDGTTETVRVNGRTLTILK
jgi:uncharacterized membrane protein YkoI